MHFFIGLILWLRINNLFWMELFFYFWLILFFFGLFLYILIFNKGQTNLNLVNVSLLYIELFVNFTADNFRGTIRLSLSCMLNFVKTFILLTPLRLVNDLSALRFFPFLFKLLVRQNRIII